MLINSRQFYLETVQFLLYKSVGLSGGLEFIIKSKNADLVILHSQAVKTVELVSQKSKLRFGRWKSNHKMASRSHRNTQQWAGILLKTKWSSDRHFSNTKPFQTEHLLIVLPRIGLAWEWSKMWSSKHIFLSPHPNCGCDLMFLIAVIEIGKKSLNPPWT